MSSTRGVDPQPLCVATTPNVASMLTVFLGFINCQDGREGSGIADKGQSCSRAKDRDRVSGRQQSGGGQ